MPRVRSMVGPPREGDHAHRLPDERRRRLVRLLPSRPPPPPPRHRRRRLHRRRRRELRRPWLRRARSCPRRRSAGRRRRSPPRGAPGRPTAPPEPSSARAQRPTRRRPRDVVGSSRSCSPPVAIIVIAVGGQHRLSACSSWWPRPLAAAEQVEPSRPSCPNGRQLEVEDSELGWAMCCASTRTTAPRSPRTVSSSRATATSDESARRASPSRSRRATSSSTSRRWACATPSGSCWSPAIARRAAPTRAASRATQIRRDDDEARVRRSFQKLRAVAVSPRSGPALASTVHSPSPPSPPPLEVVVLARPSKKSCSSTPARNPSRAFARVRRATRRPSVVHCHRAHLATLLRRSRFLAHPLDEVASLRGPLSS